MAKTCIVTAGLSLEFTTCRDLLSIVEDIAYMYRHNAELTEAAESFIDLAKQLIDACNEIAYY